MEGWTKPRMRRGGTMEGGNEKEMAKPASRLDRRGESRELFLGQKIRGEISFRLSAD